MRQLARHLPKPAKTFIKRMVSCATWDPWVNYSWSQEGEDRILARFFGKKQAGFYIDVGAHHPKRFSNTYAFYRQGWCGINIDAMPGSMELFRKHRRRDINLEIGVGREKGELEYFIFNEPALNGFNKAVAEKRHASESKYKIDEVKVVPVLPLSEVLAEHIPSKTNIDFMSIDVEGLDLEVLESNDWDRFWPTVVLVEILKSSMHELLNIEVNQFMEGKGYRIYAKCVNTVFFVRQ